MYLETVRLLNERGHQAIPFAAQDPREDLRNEASPHAKDFPKAANFDNPGIKDAFQYIYNADARRCMQRVIDEHKPDVAHLHIYYGKLTNSIFKPLRQAGIPIVHTLHEYRLINPNYELTLNDQINTSSCGPPNAWRAVPQRFNRGSLKRSLLATTEWYVGRLLGSARHIDRFIAVSDAVRDTVIQYGIPPEKVVTIHNGVAAPSPSPSLKGGRSAMSLGKSPPHILYFGRIEKLKGVLTLLDAVTPLTNIQVSFAGTGSALPELETQIKKRNLSHVKILGFVRGQALHDLIRNATCTVCPSEWPEPFPTTVLESFAHGTPVIGTHIGGIPEMIDHDVNGLLIEPGDTTALQHAIQQVTKSSKSSETLGQAAERKVKAAFSLDRYADDLIQLYQNLR